MSEGAGYTEPASQENPFPAVLTNYTPLLLAEVMTVAFSHLESCYWNLNQGTGVMKASAQGKSGLCNIAWLGTPFCNTLPSFNMGILSSKDKPFCGGNNASLKTYV